jgi:hypothetical protein
MRSIFERWLRDILQSFEGRPTAKGHAKSKGGMNQKSQEQALLMAKLMLSMSAAKIARDPHEELSSLLVKRTVMKLMFSLQTSFRLSFQLPEVAKASSFSVKFTSEREIRNGIQVFRCDKSQRSRSCC